MARPAYNYQHQMQRAAAMAAMPDGAPCPDCGLPMYRDKARNWDGRSLHYDHIIPVSAGGARGPKQLCHAFCNQSRGGKIGAAIINRRRLAVPQPRPQPRPRQVYDRW